MSNKKQLQKLELTWIGKGEDPKLEPRILIECPEYSYWEGKEQGKPAPWASKNPAHPENHKNPVQDNMLIHGDNLLALKALEQDYAGKIKCIYIDPPYNTGNAFEHYDDGVEHSLWLSLMNVRLKILRNLLSEDGLIWITLDDNEFHYCKVMCDEIFGRDKFIGTVIWEKSDSPRMDATFFSVRHDYNLVYGKSKSFLYKELSTEIPTHYNRKDDKGRIYYTKPLRVMGGNVSDSLFFPMIAPDGTEVLPYESDGSKGCWRWSKKKVEAEFERIEWVDGRNGWNPYFRIYADTRRATPTETIWTHQEVGSNRTSKNEIRTIFKEDIFATPKPERLIEKIFKISTQEGDLVLDSFLGSGTTAAVANKMGRRWIGVELGEHAKTHCVPRLKQVVDGEQGGISKAVNWKGGGGFKFYTLAPSLLKQDKFGNWVISQEYNADMLAAAMAKQEGFKYKPHESTYWKQGQSAEQDFIFTTTQFLTVEVLDSIKDEMQPGETLLICCKSFQKECKGKFSNITIKKIPLMLLGRCEYGKEDYSLNIINMPTSEQNSEDFKDGQDFEDDKVSVQELADKNTITKKNDRSTQTGLFD